ncbi:MAG: hypothetical protein OXU20_42045, partial [Myxococcales bacterium]|nr:hypothetical protein [Myxococcales bacterium]
MKPQCFQTFYGVFRASQAIWSSCFIRAGRLAEGTNIPGVLWPFGPGMRAGLSWGADALAEGDHVGA